MNKKLTLLLMICLLTQISSSQLSKCEQKCNQVRQCLDHCEKQKQQNIKTTLIITLVLIMFFIAFCGCCFICTHHKFRKFRLMFNTDYKRFKQTYNNVVNNTMSVSQFNDHARNIEYLFNGSYKYHNFISIENDQRNIEKVYIQTKLRQQFLYKIQLKGEDEVGKWSASGFIVNNEAGVVCWFLKQYDNDFTSTSRVKQKKDKIVYISNPSNLQQLDGTFYRLIQHNQNPKKGQWILRQFKQQHLQQTQSKISMQK